MDAAPGKPRKVFDRELFERKLHTPARRMQIETRSRWRVAEFQWRKLHQSSETGLFTTLVDIGIAVLCEYLKEIDGIARDVWRTQGNAVNAAFVRVLEQEIYAVIDARMSAVSEELIRRLHLRPNELTPVKHHLAGALRQLKAEMANHYEIEVQEIAYGSQSKAIADPSEVGRTANPFTHSDDYRTVKIRAETHTLTTHQAAMIQILHEAHENGNPDVSIVRILDRRGTPNSRWQDTWKSNQNARTALIQRGARKGTLRLNL
jgi:hypothetical protein